MLALGNKWTRGRVRYGALEAFRASRRGTGWPIERRSQAREDGAIQSVLR